MKDSLYIKKKLFVHPLVDKKRPFKFKFRSNYGRGWSNRTFRSVGKQQIQHPTFCICILGFPFSERGSDKLLFCVVGISSVGVKDDDLIPLGFVNLLMVSWFQILLEIHEAMSVNGGCFL